jgi:hypothetical protein
MTPALRSWFGKAGFREEAFDSSHDRPARRLSGPTRDPQLRLWGSFAFLQSQTALMVVLLAFK